MIKFSLQCRGDEELMIKDLAWNTFKKTGNINSYLEFVEAGNIERQMEQNLLITEEKKNINKVNTIKTDITNS